jgi:hypothetical protein
LPLQRFIGLSSSRWRRPEKDHSRIALPCGMPGVCRSRWRSARMHDIVPTNSQSIGSIINVIGLVLLILALGFVGALVWLMLQ